ncbi:MAG: hypothetical protein Q7U04_08080, partial [Bacteriovorax sp.]|nr:hypothetical protein [Bacteriovorax sp.]
IVFSAFLVLLFQKVKIPTLPALCYPAIILLGLACYWWSVPLPVRGFIGVGLFAIAVNLLPTAPSIVKNVLSFAPLKILGQFSFSIYLWQQIFYLKDLPPWLGLNLAIMSGVTSYFLIEKPARLYLNTRAAKTSAVLARKNVSN